MESFLNARMAMAGWLFVAVVISWLWGSHVDAWLTLKRLLFDEKSATGVIAVGGVLAA